MAEPSTDGCNGGGGCGVCNSGSDDGSDGDGGCGGDKCHDGGSDGGGGGIVTGDD